MVPTYLGVYDDCLLTVERPTRSQSCIHFYLIQLSVQYLPTVLGRYIQLTYLGDSIYGE